MVVSRWCARRRSERARGFARVALLAALLTGTPRAALAEQPASPATEREPPPPPAPPAGASDTGAASPPPPSSTTAPPVPAVPPPPPEPYVAPPDPYVPPPDPYVPDTAGPHPRRWYGWQTLAADTAAIALFSGGVAWALSNPLGADDGPALGLVGASYAIYVLGAPVVHFVHGSSKKGFGDIALRLFGPPLAGAVGAGLCTAVCSNGGGGDLGDLRPLVGFVFGTMAGLIAVPIVDAAALAYDPATSRAAPRHARVELSWVPDLAIRRDGGVVAGVRGGF